MQLPSPIAFRHGFLRHAFLHHAFLRLGALRLGAFLAVALSLVPAAALAQAQDFLLKPGSTVGPATKVKSNCVTAKDGTVTCDTELENPPDDTPAQPQLQFKN